MIDSMSKVNALRQEFETQNDISYDAVIFTRPDILFLSDFDVHDILTLHKNNTLEDTVFTACHIRGNKKELDQVNCTDVIFLSHPKNFERFFSNPEIFLNLFQPNKKFDLGPEYYFIKSFLEFNLNICLLDFLFNRDFEILRLREEQSKKLIILTKIKKFFNQLLPNKFS